MEENINVQGAEAQEATEPAETTATEPVNPTEGADEANSTTENATEANSEPNAERNTEEDARFASVRRKAEADAKAKYEAQLAQANAEFKRLFGEYTNPLTGKPIESAADYIAAFEAQQRQQRDAELRAKGIDPKMIEDAINNSPIVRQAEAMNRQFMEAEAQRQLASDIKAIGEIDPTIKSEADLLNHPSYQKVFDLVSKNGLSLTDAYKLANYSELSAKQNAAVKQAAINQAKGKAHMEATGSGHSTDDNLVEVPASTLAIYREAYPGLSDSELKLKYNEFLKKTGGQ